MPEPSSRHTRGYGNDWEKLRTRAKHVYPWLCHLCGQPIDPRLAWPHPESWTLDHLDPIAINGTRLPHIDRVRPAHLRCNVTRSNKARRRRRAERQSKNW